MSGPIQLAEHFFRQQSGQLIATLTRRFGTHNLEVVEDAVQVAFMQALQSWGRRGQPVDPEGWLFRVACNATLDSLRRRQRWQTKIGPALQELQMDESAPGGGLRADFPCESEIDDDRLQLLCLCCHPQLSVESQVAFALRMTCGFSTVEIAKALLSETETMQRRLTRAKETLRNAVDPLSRQDFISGQLPSVLRVVYLIFNEGYNSCDADQSIREDLCEEALRLGGLIARHSAGDTPPTRALMALMVFQSARFAARLQSPNEPVLLPKQDRSRWDRALIGEGVRWLRSAAEGDELSPYHLEAAIAAEHCLAPRFEETPWLRIVERYDLLMQIQPTPIHQLNRAIALAYAHGPQAGLKSLLDINWDDVPRNYFLFDAALGELHRQVGQFELAQHHLRRALSLNPPRAERQWLHSRLAAAKNGCAEPPV